MNQKVVCPKCGSEQLTANQKGYSAGKAVAGAVLTGGIGLIAGFHGSKDVIVTCLACGKQFKAGEGKVINDAVQFESNYVESNTSWYRTCDCGKICFDTHRYCFGCGKELDPSKDMIEHKNITYPLTTCKKCGKMAVKIGNFCPYCKAEMIEQKTGCLGVFLMLIIVGSVITFCFL